MSNHEHDAHVIAQVLESKTPLESSWAPAIPLQDDTPPAPPRFDLEMMPIPLRNWAEIVARSTSASLTMVAITIIVAAGAALGRTLGIFPKAPDEGWKVLGNVWGAVIAPPGALKSPIIRICTWVLAKLEDEAAVKFAAAAGERAALRTQLEGVQSDLKVKLAALNKSGGDPNVVLDQLAEVFRALEEIPTEPERYTVQDATVEKLGELMAYGARSLFVLRDELSGWLENLSKPGRQGDRAFYLEAWSGVGSFTWDRISRGTVRTTQLCLSVFGGIQPGKIAPLIQAAIKGKGGADGLMQRFQLLVRIDQLDPWVRFDEPTDPVLHAYIEKLYRGLANIREVLGLDDSAETVFIHFCEAAQLIFNDWHDRLEIWLRSDSRASTPAFTEHISKYRSLMPALALIFYSIDHAAGSTSSRQVGAEHVQRAIEWCDFLKAHARIIYWDEFELHISPARVLLGKIKTGDVTDGATVREVYRKGWRGLETAELVLSALDVLTANNIARIESVPTDGAPTNIIKLHPDFR